MPSGLRPGDRIGRYRVESVLGQGAIGVVLLAVDTEAPRASSAVAIKVLQPHAARDPETLARFRREVDILRRLGHPGVVEAKDAGRTEDGRDFLVMEHLRGETLADRIGRGALGAAEWLELLSPLGDALFAAHRQGVVHRDLTPENVFLPSEGAPIRILDFGLGLLSASTRLTHTGEVLGTPRYMAPEQIRSVKSADARADIYALGVMSHEALSGGISPFAAEGRRELLGCIVEGRVERLEDIRPDLPHELGPVVRRAMAKDPEDRYPTAAAFVDAFTRALGEPGEPRHRRRASTPRTRLWLTAALALTLGALAIAWLR